MKFNGMYLITQVLSARARVDNKRTPFLGTWIQCFSDGYGGGAWGAKKASSKEQLNRFKSDVKRIFYFQINIHSFELN